MPPPPRPTRAEPPLRPDGDLYEPRSWEPPPERPPDEDWTARYGAPPPPPRASAPDFSALFALLDVARRAAPAELQERVTTLIREALLTLRSLIDWYLDRLDGRPREAEVEDIPIE